jgi:periplasmic protein TonB
MTQAPSPHLRPEAEPVPRGVTLQRVQDAIEPGSRLGLWFSVGIHVLGLVGLLAFGLLAPKKVSTVPVFELVNLSPPKLRPLRPKTVKPPEPPPPEPVRAPEAPKLTTQPTKAVPNKPEPKVVRENPDTTLKASEAPPEVAESQTQIVSHVPSDPRLAFWASRVKKKAEAMWNPPAGLDIAGKVTAMVAFKVARDGLVTGATLSASTGNDDLDAQALQTIQRMDHVPPLPENFPDDEVQVSYEFVYKGQ